MSGHDDRLVRRAMQAAAGQGALGPCPDAELLGLYAERGLGGDERPAIEAHVADCTRCQSVVAALVRSAPESPAAGVGVSGGASPTWWQGWRWLVPVTAMAAVVMLAVWVGRPPATSEMAPVQEEAAAVATGRTAQEPAAAPGAAAAPDRQNEPARELAFRAPVASAERDQLAAGNRQTRPSAAPSDLAKQAATPPAAARADAEAAATLADARERTAAAAAAPPAPAPTPAPVPAAPAELRETMTVATPAAPTVAPQPPAARRAERDAAAKPEAEEMARARSADGLAKETGRGAATGGLAAAKASQPSGELTGRVTYRTREALPAGAVVEVRLLDVSRADAPATVIARTEVVTRGEQVPVPFVVRYDTEAIDTSRRYALQATITVAGRVAYRTTTARLVLTSGAPAAGVEVVVEAER